MDCGADVPREEMFGVAPDLRCRACADDRRKRYQPLRRTSLRVDGLITRVLVGIAITVAVFDQLPQYVPALKQVFVFGTPANYLAAYPPAVWAGEVWRLVTSTLVHSNAPIMGILHVGFNCYLLWQFGPVVEAWMGRWRYIGFFVLLSVSSVAAQIFWTKGTPVGLSGVVYGLFGLLFAMRRHKDFAQQLMTPAVVQTLVIWFFICIVMSSRGGMNVANVAHLVGALTGWLFGYAALQKQRIAIMTILSIACLGIGASTVYMPWDYTYCVFRYQEAAQANNMQAALDWLQKAAKAPNAPAKAFQGVRR